MHTYQIVCRLVTPEKKYKKNVTINKIKRKEEIFEHVSFFLSDAVRKTPANPKNFHLIVDCSRVCNFYGQNIFFSFAYIADTLSKSQKTLVRHVHGGFFIV